MDDDGFRAFVHARLGRLSRVAYLLTGDHHTAEDLLQEALIKLAAHWARVSVGGEPDAYVRMILYREHVSRWRRSRNRVAERLTAEAPEPAGRDEAEDTVRRVAVQQALARLTPRQRAVIVLRYFEDLTEAETAVVLRCSVGTVKSQTHHALRRLREHAAGVGEEHFGRAAAWTR